MLKVLIADDEKIEREGIHFLIKKYGFDLDILEAENGVDAEKMLAAESVDILITDIRMPFLDGLELSQRARLGNPDIVVVIFSAYGEFDYAKKAIDSRVQHYILKPVDPDEFFDVLSDAVVRCNMIREKNEQDNKIKDVYLKGIEYSRDSLLFDLLNDGIVDEKTVRFFRDLGLELEGRKIRIVYIDAKERFFDGYGNDFERWLSYITDSAEFLSLNEYQGVVFLFDSDADKSRDELFSTGNEMIAGMEKIRSTIISVMFGELITSPEDIYDEYRRIEDLSETNFYHERSQVFFAGEISRESEILTEIVDRWTDDIKGALRNRDFHFAADGLSRLFEELRKDAAFSSVYVKYICGDILHSYSLVAGRKYRADFIRRLEEIFAEHSLIKLKDHMLSLFDETMRDLTEEDRGGMRRVIDKVEKIIEEEYCTDLSLEYIAKKVYLTPTYLSYLFKQETGSTLMKYLTSYRMERACKLLKETNKKVADICTEVGYANLSYFCSIFKSHFKTTPAKYREAGG